MPIFTPKQTARWTHAEFGRLIGRDVLVATDTERASGFCVGYTFAANDLLMTLRFDSNREISWPLNAGAWITTEDAA